LPRPFPCGSQNITRSFPRLQIGPPCPRPQRRDLRKRFSTPLRTAQRRRFTHAAWAIPTANPAQQRHHLHPEELPHAAGTYSTASDPAPFASPPPAAPPQLASHPLLAASLPPPSSRHLPPDLLLSPPLTWRLVIKHRGRRGDPKCAADAGEAGRRRFLSSVTPVVVRLDVGPLGFRTFGAAEYGAPRQHTAAVHSRSQELDCVWPGQRDAQSRALDSRRLIARGRKDNWWHMGIPGPGASPRPRRRPRRADSEPPRASNPSEAKREFERLPHLSKSGTSEGNDGGCTPRPAALVRTPMAGG
jgi:hypothetical protein